MGIDTPPPSGEPANLAVALSLAAKGFAVFPVQSGGPKAKAPMPFFRWRDQSCSDPSTIREWWRKWPDAAPALDVGKSGLFVIDADRHDPEHDGVEAWAAVMEEAGASPYGIPIVATPNEGNHWIFRQEGGIGNRKGRLPKGVDVRGDGGYIVAPGAIMADGRRYECDGDPAEAPPVPDWLAGWLEGVAGEGGGGAVELLQRKAPDPAGLGLPSAPSTNTSPDEIADLLSHIPADCGYDEWVQALMAVHAATAGSSQGLAMADAWSSGGSKYKAGEVARKWKSFRSTGVNGATLAALAKQYGADLSAIRIAHMPPEDPEALAHGRKVSEMLRQAFATRSAEQDRMRGEQAKSELEWFDDVKPVVDVPYIVKGLMDHGSMSVVYGPSNSGKTFFALDLVFHIAIAHQWRDRRVNGGAVLYLAAEGGNGIANRIAALRDTFGCCDVPFALRRAGLDLLKPEADTRHVLKLAEEVEKRAPLSVIVIDTLSRVIAGGDENAASDMTAFIRNIDRIRQATGAHILIVHHTGKDAAKGARGHSSLRAATDTEIELSVDEFGGRVAKVTKQRDYEGGEEFAFSLKSIFLGKDQDGDNVSTCIVETVEKSNDRKDDMPPMNVCKSILSEIQTAYNKDNPYSMTPQSQRTGRYAPRALSKKFGIKFEAMDRLLKSWLDNEIIISSMYEARKNRSGLSVIGSLD